MDPNAPLRRESGALHGLVSLLIGRPDFPWPDADVPTELIELLTRGLVT